MPVDERNWLAQRFEEHRSHLRAVAYRMLGSASEADDAVQEAWLRLDRSDTSAVENLGGWLTTVVARVCLDVLRSRQSRREEPLDAHVPEPIVSREPRSDPEQQALLADSVGLALLVVLDTLPPPERVASSRGSTSTSCRRSPGAARQLASRARRRVQGATGAPSPDRTRQRKVVDAFLAASRNGDFNALLAVLHPDVVLRADPAAVRMGAAAEVYGAKPVAETFRGRAQAAQPALVNGTAGLVWIAGGQPRVVFQFTTADAKIVAIDMIADPERLRQLDLLVLNG